MAALDDRLSPRPGTDDYAGRQGMAGGAGVPEVQDLGYPYELWTTRFLARHAASTDPQRGHACLADLAQGTVCKILGQDEGEAAQSAILPGVGAHHVRKIQTDGFG
jgi:hypothetical protein